MGGEFCFVVTTDRAAGVTSLDSDQLDIMLHRRTLRDDGKGLGEPMDDDTVINGRLVLGFGPCRSDAAYTVQEKRVTHKPLVIYREADFDEFSGGLIVPFCENTQCSLLKQNASLPKNVFVQTLERDTYRPEWLVIRLENISENEAIVQNLEDYFNFRSEIDNVQM